MVNIPIGGSTSNAVGLSSTRNSLNILLQPSVKIPQDAKNVKVFLRTLRVPYSFVNINASNNKFYFTDNPSIRQKYSFTFTPGLYSLDQLNSTLQLNLQEAINASGFAFSNNVFQYIADTATDRCYLLINSSGYQVNHDSGSFYNLTGFTENRRTPSGASLTTASSTYFLGDTTVRFQNTTDVVVSTSLPVSFWFNNQSRNFLSIVPINVSPQSTIVYPGSNVPEFEKLDCSLQGSTITSVNITLLDQNLNDLDLNGKDFSVELNITWDE